MKKILMLAITFGTVSALAEVNTKKGTIDRLFEVPGIFERSLFDSFISPFGTPQWGVKAIHAEDAWQISDQGSRAKVLVIDTGILINHPYLMSNIEEAKNFYNDSSNGILDPYDVRERVSHGTHVAGIIAGVIDSERSFSGVAPRTKLLIARVCGARSCSSTAIAEAIEWGISRGADIINISLGSSEAPGELELAAYDKAEKAGVLVVSVAGNNYTPNSPKGNIDYPGKIETVMSVGAVSQSKIRIPMSSYGPELDIVAPGESIFSSSAYIPSLKTKISSSGSDKHIKSERLWADKKAIGFLPLESPTNTEVVYVNYGSSEDFKKVDVKGKIALIKMGYASIKEFAGRCLNAGASGAYLIESSGGRLLSPGPGASFVKLNKKQSFKGAILEKSGGQEIIDLIQRGEKVVLSTFESIDSFPDFEYLSGTSMAAPHAAGVAALVVSTLRLTNPELRMSASALRELIYESAEKLPKNQKNEYGSGLIRADTAVLGLD